LVALKTKRLGSLVHLGGERGDLVGALHVGAFNAGLTLGFADTSFIPLPPKLVQLAPALSPISSTHGSQLIPLQRGQFRPV